MQTNLFPTRSYDEKNFQKTCEQAIRLLVFSGNQAPVELLLRGLRYANASIRVASISALLRLQARSTRSFLRPLLQDENGDVQVTAAWVLACWGEPVPPELLGGLPPTALRRGIAEAFPPNWSQLFSLPSALYCVASYRGLWGPECSVGGESEDIALFGQLAKGIDPQSLMKFLWHEHDYERGHGAWEILKVLESPLPLDLLPMLLSRWDAIAWETALLLGKRRVVSACDLLGEMWTLTAGKPHAAITVALDDFGMIDGVDTLQAEMQGRDYEKKAAIWGLGVLGQRRRSIPREMLYQMVHHSSPEVRTEAIRTLSSLNDIGLAEALMAVNDDSLELVAAGFQAFLVLAHAQSTIPIDVLTRRLIDLLEQKGRQYRYSYGDYFVREAIINGIQLFDKLHADISLETLLNVLSSCQEFIEPLIIGYWRRHNPDIFAEMMVQVEAFLQRHI